MYAIISDSSNAPPSTPRIRSGATTWPSPETIHPERSGITASQLTRASDCYAFGKIIYETISGSPQPHGDSGLTVLEEVFKVNSSSLLGDELAGVLWGLLEQCWEREPDARPGAEDILWCLERMLNMLKTPCLGEDGKMRGDGRGSMNNFGESHDVVLCTVFFFTRQRNTAIRCCIFSLFYHPSTTKSP